MLKIRFARKGRKKSPFYRIVVAEEGNKPTGKVIETIGYYNPLKKTKNIKKELFEKWTGLGAKPTEAVKKLLEIK